MKISGHGFVHYRKLLFTLDVSPQNIKPGCFNLSPAEVSHLGNLVVSIFMNASSASSQFFTNSSTGHSILFHGNKTKFACMLRKEERDTFGVCGVFK